MWGGSLDCPMRFYGALRLLKHKINVINLRSSVFICGFFSL